MRRKTVADDRWLPGQAASMKWVASRECEHWLSPGSAVRMVTLSRSFPVPLPPDINQEHQGMFARLMGIKTISPNGLQEMMQKQQVTVIDVTSRASWMKARVPGALNLDPAEYDDSDLPPDKDATLVFYCSRPMCKKAPNAARRAKAKGHGNAVVMSAGIGGSIAARLPTDSGE